MCNRGFSRVQGEGPRSPIPFLPPNILTGGAPVCSRVCGPQAGSSLRVSGSPLSELGSRKHTDAEEGCQGVGRRRVVAPSEEKGNARWKRGRSLEAASPQSRSRRGSRGNPSRPPPRPPAVPSRGAGAEATRFDPALLPVPLRAALQRAFDVAAGAPDHPPRDALSSNMPASPQPVFLTTAPAAVSVDSAAPTLSGR